VVEVQAGVGNGGVVGNLAVRCGRKEAALRCGRADADREGGVMPIEDGLDSVEDDDESLGRAVQ